MVKMRIRLLRRESKNPEQGEDPRNLTVNTEIEIGDGEYPTTQTRNNKIENRELY